jgi:hypothetical protein
LPLLSAVHSPSSVTRVAPSRSWAFATLLGALYSILAALYLRPIWRVFGDRIAPNEGDPIFNLWVLRWGAHQIRLGLPDFWNANIFYPNRGTLALSDHLLGPAAIQALIEELTGNPILGYNLLFFSSFVLTALATAYVVRAAGSSRFAAGLAGALFAFCPFRFAQLNHIQILWMPVLPLVLWTWDRLLAERRPWRALVFLACYLVQVSGGSYLAYMIHVPLFAVLCVRFRHHGAELLTWRAVRVLLPTAALMLALALPFFLPYLRLGQPLGLHRQPGDVVENAAVLSSYLTPGGNSAWFRPSWRSRWQRLAGVLGPQKRGEDFLFPGVTTLAFAGIGLATAGRRATVHGSRASRGVVACLWTIAAAAWLVGEFATLAGSARREPLVAPGCLWPALLAVVLTALGAIWWIRWRREDPGAPAGDTPPAPGEPTGPHPWSNGLLLTGALCFALSCAIAFIPALPVVPGFSGMRVPARFGVFVIFVLVTLAARGIDRVGGLLSPRIRPWLGLLLVAFAVVELLPRPTRWVRLERPEAMPEVYHWLAQQSDVAAVLELPIRANHTEALYMYYSTVHWKPIANGFSGLRPASHVRLTAAMRNLPSSAALDLAQSLGITHVAIHFRKLPSRLRPHEIRQWEADVAGERLLELHRSGGSRIYRFRLPAAATVNRPPLLAASGDGSG